MTLSKNNNLSSKTTADLTQGKLLFKEKKYQEAIPYLGQAATKAKKAAKLLVTIFKIYRNEPFYDYPMAGRCLNLAIKGKHPEAMYLLAKEHERDGRVVKSGNATKALELYRHAAKLGHSGAQLWAGLYFESGVGCEKSPMIAFNYYKLSAVQQEPDGLYNLSRCFIYGIGTEKNIQKGMQHGNIAASKGSVLAVYDLANFYRAGSMGFPKNLKLSQQYELKYKKLQSKSNLFFHLAQGYTGAIKDEPKITFLGIKYLHLAAGLDNTNAIYSLAGLYESGQGVSEDMSIALELYEKGSSLGMYLCSSDLANYYWKQGRRDKAVRYHKLAKKQGNPNSWALFKQEGDSCIIL